MNKELFIRRKMSELEDWGDAHNADCGVNSEEECDCEVFSEIRAALNEAWDEAASERAI